MPFMLEVTCATTRGAGSGKGRGGSSARTQANSRVNSQIEILVGEYGVMNFLLFYPRSP